MKHLKTLKDDSKIIHKLLIEGCRMPLENKTVVSFWENEHSFERGTKEAITILTEDNNKKRFGLILRKESVIFIMDNDLLFKEWKREDLYKSRENILRWIREAEYDI